MGIGLPLPSFRGTRSVSPESICQRACGSMDSGFALRAPGMTSVARRFLQNLLQRVALHPRDVVLVFQQRAERVADQLRRQRTGVEFGQRGGPVDGLGDARRLVEILVAQGL